VDAADANDNDNANNDFNDAPGEILGPSRTSYGYACLLSLDLDRCQVVTPGRVEARASAGHCSTAIRRLFETFFAVHDPVFGFIAKKRCLWGKQL